jgi:glycolate oxidase FAD binding subunit
VVDRDATEQLVDAVREAASRRQPVEVIGGGTKRFLGREPQGMPLDVTIHRGIVHYDPAELVVTARGGTPLFAVEETLAANGQCLAFEPPAFGEGATLGGVVASGLAGPSRPRSGPVRDSVLGIRLLTGDGRVLRFGGEVMKNVAGYDVARTMAGAFGTLGVLLEVSLKVLPAPSAVRTVSIEVDEARALAMLGSLTRVAHPLTASCWAGGVLHLRCAGSVGTLDAFQAKVGGEPVRDGDAFWRSVREHTHPFFAGRERLWRLHVDPPAPPLDLASEPLIEWHGLQRWYVQDGSEPGAVAGRVGGYATIFRNARQGDPVFARPADALLKLYRSLKQAFDPAGVLNPGRLYPDV